MYERTPPTEAIDDAIRARLRDVWTALPGRIVAYTAAGSTATVQPLPADYVAGQMLPLPLLYDVRVLWPSGGGASVTWTLQAGDMVLLVFASRSLDRYRTDGADGDPQSIRTHDLSDAMALPMALQTDASAPTTTADLVLTRPTGARVLLGGAAATAAVVRNADPVNMAAGGASSWLTWAALVNAALGGAPGIPGTAPTVTASSTTVEAT